MRVTAGEDFQFGFCTKTFDLFHMLVEQGGSLNQSDALSLNNYIGSHILPAALHNLRNPFRMSY
jgi:hypothetical protein